MSGKTLDQARAAKVRAAEVFAEFGPLVAIGLTRVAGGYGVKINFQRQPPSGISLPTRIDGVPVVVEITGAIRKRPLRALRRGRQARGRRASHAIQRSIKP